MPVGLQSIGDHGAVQIDQDYRNYHLSQVKEVWVGSGSATVDFGGLVAPLIGIYDSGDGACFRTITRTGDYGLFRVFRKSPGTVKIVVFDLIPPTNTGCGLQVFDGSGSLVFDSGAKYMRVLDHRGEQGTFGYGVGKVAVIPFSQYMRSDFLPWPPSPNTHYNILVQASYFAASGNVVTVSEATISNHPEVYFMDRPAYETFNHQLGYLVVDITNYGI